jgi:ABC-type nitrate/sulfonate/bicarbonate transport system ATPase subunit
MSTDNMPSKISVTGIGKSFETEQGSLRVLDNISFDVGDGDIVAIVGPSGCGKSTLMNIMAGFDRPECGSVRVDGNTLSKPSSRGILISQAGSVFPWLTVQQNLMFGLNDHDHAHKKQLADHYAAMVGLKGFERRYPHELSGGMIKRVELARALVVKPEILYMDEPFSALDALLHLRMRTELLRILEQERHTVVLITHDVEEAIHVANRVIVLSSQPTTIKATFDVSFPHPRKLSSAPVQELRAAILRELGVDSYSV